MEQSKESANAIDRGELIANLGNLATAPVTLAPSEVIADNLDSIGAKSRYVTGLFTRLSARGGESYDTIADFVIATHRDLIEYVGTDLKGFVSHQHIEARMPRYIEAMLKDQSDEIRKSANLVWRETIKELYGYDPYKIDRSDSKTVQANINNGGKIPRKKMKQIKKSRAPGQLELSAREAEREKD